MYNSPAQPAPVNDAGWLRVGVDSIEAMQQAVLGAGLEAFQLSRGAMTGSLAFLVDGPVTYSSGKVEGKVRLSGPLSETMVTLGAGIDLAPGSRQWESDAESGGIGVYMAGDQHDSLHMPGSTYAAATLPADVLEQLAADMGLVLDVQQLGGSGISERKLAPGAHGRLSGAFAAIHAGVGNDTRRGLAAGRMMLEAMIAMLAREPRAVPPVHASAGYGRVVARAEDYILAHLDQPLSVSAIARVAYASQSTLYRAFHQMLDETPQSYVRKLRLNRIRQHLASETEVRCTITTLANRWGISELGRLAGWYRETFGELPTETRRKHLAATELRSPAAALKRTA